MLKMAANCEVSFVGKAAIGFPTGNLQDVL